MPFDPAEPLTEMERRTFGVDAFRHPVCGFIVEMGQGALPVEQQVANHLIQVARAEGRAAAAALRKRVDDFKAAGGSVPEPPPPRTRMSHARQSPPVIAIKRTTEQPPAMMSAGPSFMSEENQSNVVNLKPE